MDQEILEEIDHALERIPDKTYYRIGEVARLTDLKPYVLRYWETEFRQVAPPKSKSGQRTYRKREIRALLIVKKLLYGQRFTIEGARRRLGELLKDGRSGGEEAREVRAGPALAGIRRDLERVREILANP